VLLVDHALLFAVLAGTAPENLQAAADRSELFTTGSWYWRLSRALHDPNSAGVLSRALDDLTPEQRVRVIASVRRLPQRSDFSASVNWSRS
jgi:hypothetical protein